MSHGTAILTDNVYIIKFTPIPKITQAMMAMKASTDARFVWTDKHWIVSTQYKDKVFDFCKRNRIDFEYSPPMESNFAKMPIPALPELTEQIPLKVDLFHYQGNGVAYMIDKKRAMNADEPGLGKAQPFYSKIATPSGWKTMGAMELYDRILDSKGGIQTVLGIYDQGDRPVYRITFNDGTKTHCDEEHLWTVRDHNRRLRKKGWITMTTKQLIESGLTYKTNKIREASNRKPCLKWEIPLPAAISGIERDFVIHPYILGALIGDGYMCGDTVEISIPDFEIETRERIESLLPADFKLNANRYSACPQYAFTRNKTTHKNPFKSEIKRLQLNVKGPVKFIPNEYLFASKSQRLDLLRGLMDTDGSAKNNRITFHTMSDRLANNIADLVFSLGGQAIIRPYDRSHQDKGIEYQVNVRMLECPFYMQRKVDHWAVSKRNYPSKYFESIEYIGYQPTRCIKVSAPDHLYLTDHFILTHNTGQTIASFMALNLWPVLIVCPASLRTNWQNEWHMWTNKKAIILQDSIKNTFLEYHRVGMADVFIVNYESQKKYFVKSINKPANGGRFQMKDINFNVDKIQAIKGIAFDESHRLKDSTTQTYKFARGIAYGKEVAFALTGTPVVNKPMDLAAQLHVIGRLSDFGGPREFRARYCSGPKEASNLAELNYLLNVRCFVRREKKDVLKDLPDKVRTVITCEITADARVKYNLALNDLSTYMKKFMDVTDKDIKKSMRAEIMVRIGILKQISAFGKLDEAIEYVRDIVESGNKIVVFVYHKEIADKWIAAFPGCAHMVGSDKDDARNSAKARFQNDPKCTVMITSIGVGKEGHTLTAASRVFMHEMPWTAAVSDQCEDRCHRIGQKDSVQAIYPLGKDTYDQKIYDIIQTKRQIANAVTGSEDDVTVDFVDTFINLFNHK